MLQLLLISWMALSSPAAAQTGDTGDTTNATDTGFLTDTAVACADCLSAAELANEAGGSPCNECSSTSTPAAAGSLFFATLFATRRRRTC